MRISPERDPEAASRQGYTINRRRVIFMKEHILAFLDRRSYVLSEMQDGI